MLDGAVRQQQRRRLHVPVDFVLFSVVRPPGLGAIVLRPVPVPRMAPPSPGETVLPLAQESSGREGVMSTERRGSAQRHGPSTGSSGLIEGPLVWRLSSRLSFPTQRGRLVLPYLPYRGPSFSGEESVVRRGRGQGETVLALYVYAGVSGSRWRRLFFWPCDRRTSRDAPFALNEDLVEGQRVLPRPRDRRDGDASASCRPALRDVGSGFRLLDAGRHGFRASGHPLRGHRRRRGVRAVPERTSWTCPAPTGSAGTG